MSQKLTREQAFAHASALLPIVAITGTMDGYSHGWTVVPKLSYNRKVYTTETGTCHYIGHDNIDWQTDDIAKRIYVPTPVRNWRPARMPEDYGKLARFRDADIPWREGIIAGYDDTDECSWIAKNSGFYEYAEVLDDAPETVEVLP